MAASEKCTIFMQILEATHYNKRDGDTRNIASSLMLKLKSFQFICSLVTWLKILTKINVVSKILQKPDVVLPEAVKMIEQAKNNLATMRTDSAFDSMLLEATSIAEEIECETVFTSIGQPRPRKRFFSYEHADEKITDPQNNFKVNFYFHLFDVAITKLNERFELLRQLCIFTKYRQMEKIRGRPEKSSVSEIATETDF
ncbi:hypothetical protein JRQ81_019668 [Phrynocephalus forsythii]|uniref:Uncharacterized protein n=1 Tax=Phrynocephalus forsythii TaxID=171643 RepID=A0A9Q0XNE7_9SAUR|nr:hypothetical protein JRQ81_019668 [Phrynocephalus forsythii]